MPCGYPAGAGIAAAAAAAAADGSSMELAERFMPDRPCICCTPASCCCCWYCAAMSLPTGGGALLTLLDGCAGEGATEPGSMPDAPPWLRVRRTYSFTGVQIGQWTFCAQHREGEPIQVRGLVELVP